MKINLNHSIIASILLIFTFGLTAGKPSNSTNAKLVSKSITTGFSYACALLNDGTIRCWGHNDAGQLGNGTTTVSSVPVKVSGITKAVALAGGSSHTCAVLSDGTIQCWGYNHSGQLGNINELMREGHSVEAQVLAGNNGPERCSPVPVTVSGISTAIASTTGFNYACALLSGGTIQCWGEGKLGQLGDGNANWNPVPVKVTGITNAVAVSAGNGNYTCAVLKGGSVQCWGQNKYGELGNGTIIDSSVPVTVTGITNAVAVSASGTYACAVLSNGTVQCWGNERLVPVTVSGINSAIAVTGNCALLSGGTIQCWRAKLGKGSRTSNPVLIMVSDITNAIALSAGDGHICTLLNGGSVQCQGQNMYGQLGNGTTTNSSVPVTVTGF